MDILGLTFSSGEAYLLGIAGTLAATLTYSILQRARDKGRVVDRDRRALRKTVVAPFRDTLINLEQGTSNHVAIMNSLFPSHDAAMSQAKAHADDRRKAELCRAWDAYVAFYKAHAANRVLDQFLVSTAEDFRPIRMELERRTREIIALLEK